MGRGTKDDFTTSPNPFSITLLLVHGTVVLGGANGHRHGVVVLVVVVVVVVVVVRRMS